MKDYIVTVQLEEEKGYYKGGGTSCNFNYSIVKDKGKASKLSSPTTAQNVRRMLGNHGYTSKVVETTS